MKKLILFISFILCFVFSFGQTKPPIVPRSGGSVTVSDSNLFIGNSFRVPIFPDTATANSRRPSLDSSGKLIYTFDQNAIWYRSNHPRRWVQFTGSSIVNIFNNSITNITFISQVDSSVTVEICTGVNVCDTISFITNITNLDSTSIHFIDSTHFSICGIDTIGGTPVEQCDTVTIPTQQLYSFQNWLRQVSAGIVEFGSNQAGTSNGLFLGHNTFTNTGNFRFFEGGYTVYNYPINFFQDQSFMNGSGIVSFKGKGQAIFGADPNLVRLGVNFWGDTVNNTPPIIPGYFTDATRRFGYGFGTNITANGSYGMNQDDSVSKNVGIFFHTTDVTNDEGVSIYAAPSVGGTYVGNLSAYFNAHFRTNGDIRWPFYPYSRSDGFAGRFLTTDSIGNMQLRTIPNSDSCGLFTGGIVTWDSLLTYDVSASQYALCCDNIFRTTDFDTVQLAEPDSNFLRYDAIVVGVNGVEVVQGVESTDPEQPQLDSCQALLTYILVIGPHDTVAATQNICPSSIYDENYNNEFVVSSVTGVTVDTANTVSVAHLTKSLNVGTWTSGSFRFLYSPTDISDAFALKFYINLKAVLPLATRIRLDWMDGTTVVSTTLALGGPTTAFGFSRLVLGYQTVTIPITAWTFTSKTITTLRVTLVGAGSGFYMDWVQLQGCGVSTAPPPSNVSFASGNLLPLFTTSVANPTTNITQSFTQVNATAYTVFGNPFDTAAPRQDFTINLSTPQTVGLLNVERIAPCGEGYFIATIDGVQTCVPNPVDDINQVKVIPPLFIDTTDNAIYDTLSLRYNNGLSMTAVDSSLQLGSSSSTGAPLVHHTYLYGASTYTLDLNDLRFELDKGVNITAANNLTLGLDGNVFTVTGNTQINAITTANWQAGSQVELIFTGTPTVKNNTAGGAGTATILLAGSVDFTAAANDVLSIVYDGTSWHESARKTAGSITSMVGRNGITDSVDRYILGGTLYKNTTESMAGWTLTMSGANTGTNILTVNNTGTGFVADGIRATVTAGTAINGSATSGTAVFGSATSGIGGYFQSTSNSGLFVSTARNGEVATIQNSNTNINSVITGIGLYRQPSSGTPVNGIGISFDFGITASTGGGTSFSNSIISKWTDATTATRTSQLSITGVNGAVTGTILSINGGGALLYTTNVVSGASNTITANSAAIQVFSGSSGTTWTLPAIGNTGLTFTIKNRGSAAITLNSNGGGNDIYTTSAVSSLTINAGESYILTDDGTKWIAY